MGTFSEQYNVATDLESYSKLVSESVSSNIIKLNLGTDITPIRAQQ